MCLDRLPGGNRRNNGWARSSGNDIDETLESERDVRLRLNKKDLGKG